MYIALIGGKSNKEVPVNRIELELFKYINKANPNILYCPFASINNIEKSNNKFERQMSGINCNITFMSKDDSTRFKKLLEKCDCLYVGGGSCDDLVEFFKENNMIDPLIDFINTDNKLFIGSSAGAMLLTNISMGDKYMFNDNFHNYNYKMVECLKLLNISICPHYQNEDLIIYNDYVNKYNFISFGIEEDTALVINNNKYFILKDDSSKSVYEFNPNNNYIMKPLYEGEVYEDCNFRS